MRKSRLQLNSNVLVATGRSPRNSVARGRAEQSPRSMTFETHHKFIRGVDGRSCILVQQDKHAPDTTTFAVSRLKMGTGLMPESYSSLCKAHSQFRTTPAAAPIQIQKQMIKLIGHDPLTKLAHAELPSKTHTKANHRRLSRRATPNWFF